MAASEFAFALYALSTCWFFFVLYQLLRVKQLIAFEGRAVTCASLAR